MFFSNTAANPLNKPITKLRNNIRFLYFVLFMVNCEKGCVNFMLFYNKRLQKYKK